MSKYQVNRKTLGLSKLYQHGKTHVPSEVRKMMTVKDGDRLLWFVENGKVVVEVA